MVRFRLSFPQFGCSLESLEARNFRAISAGPDSDPESPLFESESGEQVKISPKHLSRLFVASKVILFSQVIFKCARKMPCKTSINQKSGDHPNFRKNAFVVKRPFSELWESSGVFSEQLSEFRN